MVARTPSPTCDASGGLRTQPPPYSPAINASPSSSAYSLPGYGSTSTLTASSFSHTASYQVESKGSQWLSLPTAPKLDPITVYAIGPAGAKTQKVYESIRPEQRSGSCSLYAARSDHSVSSTTYRFGPGRPPVIHLHCKSLESSVAESAARKPEDEGFEVMGRGATTRSVRMRTPLGTYQWRYGRRSERKACNADSLLILDKVTTVALAGGKTKDHFTRVAEFIRNDEFRTQGTGKADAGNGGRLMMDLRDSDKKSSELEVLVVTGLICMLKREVDRRRGQKMLMIAAAVSGGGP
ncbi:uncharacterized protein J7T54_005019 [Emericellopsis cladophorae]|uniref:Uncharacterized protein n=1 Tax=Emericellopsis cladophorae TaxID=2686198 RepID=A0A9P9Y2B2_9HYPO|nr:uncharacterized protein J7T54_005019 [Emericellopsis cladophorae]KAI6781853.1 hypothetical protein J7T54_005019 [Emericellopsis cladophorae]